MHYFIQENAETPDLAEEIDLLRSPTKKKMKIKSDDSEESAGSENDWVDLAEGTHNENNSFKAYNNWLVFPFR